MSKFLRSCACGCSRGDVVVCGKAPQSSCMVMKLPRLDFWSCCQGLLKNVKGVYERGSGGRGRLMDAVRLGGENEIALLLVKVMRILRTSSQSRLVRPIISLDLRQRGQSKSSFLPLCHSHLSLQIMPHLQRRAPFFQSTLISDLFQKPYSLAFAISL